MQRVNTTQRSNHFHFLPTAFLLLTFKAAAQLSSKTRVSNGQMETRSEPALEQPLQTVGGEKSPATRDEGCPGKEVRFGCIRQDSSNGTGLWGVPPIQNKFGPLRPSPFSSEGHC